MQTTENELTEILTEETENVTTIFTKLADQVEGHLPSLLFGVLVFLMGMVIIRLIMKALNRGLDRSKVERTAGSFLHSLVSAVLYVILAVIVLSVLGVPMTSIITVIGTAGLVLLCVQMAFLMVPISLTEKALKENFDTSGKRK